MVEIHGGYYIKARMVQESKISIAPPHIREIWDWILRECNHSSNHVCKRGQCVRTYSDIQEGLKWFIGYRKMTYKKHHCEIALKWLLKENMITTAKTTRGVLITVCNYDIYQNPKNYESHTKETTATTMKLQCTDTINKNDKNDNNDKNKEKRGGFTPPALSDVKNYCLDRNNGIDPEGFIDFYTSKNWFIGKTKMKDWKAAVRTWERRDRSESVSGHNQSVLNDWAKKGDS